MADGTVGYFSVLFTCVLNFPKPLCFFFSQKWQQIAAGELDFRNLGRTPLPYPQKQQPYFPFSLPHTNFPATLSTLLRFLLWKSLPWGCSIAKSRRSSIQGRKQLEHVQLLNSHLSGVPGSGCRLEMLIHDQFQIFPGLVSCQFKIKSPKLCYSWPK